MRFVQHDKDVYDKRQGGVRKRKKFRKEIEV